MRAKLSQVLDECIVRIRNGETIEACLAQYPDLQKQLEPLLYLGLSLSAIPKVSPSEEFRKTSRARLMAQLRQESIPTRRSETSQSTFQPDKLATLGQGLWHSIIRARKVAIPVAAALVIVLVASILLPGVLDLISPPPAIASPCTLSTLGGTVELQKTGLDSWQPGIDGMTLAKDTKVRTTGDAHALLTFFDGSTIKLEPDTVVGIQQVELTDGGSVTIVVKQFVGRTWSRVEKTGTSSYYNIETPSANVIAHGTLFTVDVDEIGRTRVSATEGLVSVISQSEEVHLEASQQTRVEVGTAPSKPEKVPAAKAELVITVDMPAVGSVRDPSGASTGYLPNGLSFNQITSSVSSLLDDGSQVISITQPATGEYVFTMRYAAAETARLNIVSKSEGKVVFKHSEELAGVRGEGWLIRIKLNVDNGQVESCAVVGIEPLGDTTPEKIVVTDLARERAVPIQPTTRDDVQDDRTGDTADDENVSNDTDDMDTPDITPDRDNTGDTDIAVTPDATPDSDDTDTVVTPDTTPDKDNIGDTDTGDTHDSTRDRDTDGDKVGARDASDSTGIKETNNSSRFASVKG